LRVECHGEADLPSIHDRVVVFTLSVPRSVHFEPADWVMVRVPSVSFLETHPFTISSVRAEGERQVLTLHILALPTQEVSRALLARQARGGVPEKEPTSPSDFTWSHQVYELAQRAIGPGKERRVDFEGAGDAPPFLARRRSLSAATADAMESGRSGSVVLVAEASKNTDDGELRMTKFAREALTLTLDGPYRSLRFPWFRFRALVLCAGGIGITPLISFLDVFMRRVDESSSAAAAQSTDDPIPDVVYLIWTSRSAKAFSRWFPQQMEALAHCPRVKCFLHSTHPVFDADLQEAGFQLPPPPVGFVLPKKQEKELPSDVDVVTDVPAGVAASSAAAAVAPAVANGEDAVLLHGSAGNRASH